MSETHGVGINTDCVECGQCALSNLKKLLTDASPSTGIRRTNIHALRDVIGFKHPDDSKGYNSFGSKCPPEGNCGRLVKGGLFTRTAEAATNLVPQIVERAQQVGMRITAQATIFRHRFTL